MSGYVWGNQETQFFFDLTPETILDTVSKHQCDVTGRVLTLNSMENRVYEVEIDNAEQFHLANNSIIIKFYRPGRWSEQQIRDEHEFLLELYDSDIPVIPPIKFDNETLFKSESTGLFYTMFPKKGGRAPDEMNKEQLEIIGRTLARLHNIGASKPAKARIKISPDTYGKANLNYLLDTKSITSHLEAEYKDLVESICEMTSSWFDGITYHRIHGDCHCGNIISRDSEGLFLIDFDDMLVGPAIQDIWLVVPGIDEYAIQDRNTLIDSYLTMREFNFSELKLIEPLRTLRFIHFSAWIAKRWEDPAFKNAFPHFSEPQYWEIQVNDLRKQKNLIQNLNQPSYY